MLSLLSRLDAGFARLSRLLLIFLCLFLTGLMATAVFLRYGLDQAFPAIEEISILTGLWLYFIAMVLVTRERSHLTGGIMELLNLTPKQRTLIKAFNDLVGLTVICFFGFYATKYLLFIMKINRASTNLGWPTALWVSAAVAGFTLMALYKLRDLFSHSNTYSQYDNKSLHARDAVLKESQ
ncbi:TRAP transporter small permease [Aliamphritea spongicola]|uniref:TRAP transporter small permease n=1 Tax=Aliamphritea spongicola TaxID=707589 RepID=UPI00196AA0B9|nr:TRAP transporter small permease [Aliamphritea spongicola]MBN3560972.1 TRAP transporter small permease [Aliamphritea spongicola]